MSTSNHKNARAAKGPYAVSRKMIWISRILTILFSLAVIFPIIFIILTSFKNNNEFYTNIFGFPSIWRIENFGYAWTKGQLSKYAGNSVIATVTTVFASVLLTSLGGYALSKLHIPRANAIINVFLVFNFVPGVAIYIPLYSQLIQMHLNKTIWMLILPYIAWTIPISLFIFKQFFDSIPNELIEAARIDGSSELSTFFRVIFPLVTPAVATVMVFNFINTWGEYMWASIAATASSSTITLPVGLIYFRGQYGIEWGPFAAAIVIIIVPLMLLFIYLQKYFIQGITSGAVKG